jgi:hypothetical protein
MKRRESGNIIFIILLAIVLIGLVTAALRSGGLESAGIDREDLTIKVAQVRQNAAEIERGVTFVLNNGISETDISFAHPDAPSDYGAYGANPAAEVFNPQGGAAAWRDAPSGILFSSSGHWEFYGSTAIPGAGSDKADLIAVLPGVTKAFCAQINQINGQTSAQPSDPAACVNGGSADRFNGAPFAAVPNTMDVPTFTAVPALEACVECAGGDYHYYHTLLVR